MPPQAGPSCRVKIDVAVHDEYVERVGFTHERLQQRQLPLVEPAWDVVGDLVEPCRPLLEDRAEPGVVAHHQGGMPPTG
ncbi:hypothetical protein [Nocardioides sp. NPDC047086]|uniref:hypothetical protein n=1 Tax=Nocardioides sp. NPDC047086 TaxID=3154810 RepID=UPI0033D4BCD5